MILPAPDSQVTLAQLYPFWLRRAHGGRFKKPPTKKKKKKKERKTKKREKEKRKKIIIIKRILQIEKWFSYGQIEHFASNVLLNRNRKPCQSAPGSLGLDLSSTTATILTPDMLVTLIPMGVADPLPEGIVLLVLGHSLLSFQGISVVSGVVDSDYTEKIKVLALPPTKTVQINKD